MSLSPLDVIWIDDGCIQPPGPKMVVCIEPQLGLFFRINSKPHWQTPVKLDNPPHTFLRKTVSYLECGEPLDLDEFVIDESLRDRGVIGQVSSALAPQIFAVVQTAKRISNADKESIRKALGC